MSMIENGSICLLLSNKIREVDFSFNELGHFYPISEVAFKFEKSLRRINLEGNDIGFDGHSTLLRKHPSLTALRVSGNRFSFGMGENYGMFENDHELELLYLNGCKLKTIPRQELAGLVNMKYMDFSLNQLSDFDVNVTTMDQLSFINLSYNRSEILPEHVASYLDHLPAVTNITVDLTSNPLLCQCNISHHSSSCAGFDIRL